jgi:hypothetical protein
VEQQNWPRSQRELDEGPIQVRVPNVERIFNPMDPQPLDERSLNIEVADWIEEWAEDIDGDEAIVLEIYVADASHVGREALVVAGLRNHFEYRQWATARQLSRLWRDGRISLLIGIAALAGFNAASRLIGSSDNPVVEVIHEGLSIVGWVSLWKPLEIFLYEWWPIRREYRAYQRLADAEVQFPDLPGRGPLRR